MKAWYFVTAMFLLAGCDQRKPAVRNHTEFARALDEEVANIRAYNPGIKEACLKKVRSGEFGANEWMNNADCFDMLPAQHWSGLWNSGWEWTNFCPAPATACPIAAEHGDVWLIFAKGAYPDAERLEGIYRIEFVGRRTKVPGYFGHLSQYNHLMVVDRVISIAKVPERRQN